MKKFTYLSLGTLIVSGVLASTSLEAQTRERTLGFSTDRARAIKNSTATPNTTKNSTGKNGLSNARVAKLSGRCAQIVSQSRKLQLRKQKLISSRKWQASQLKEIARNFGDAEKNLASLFQRCRKN
ncbi:MAG: hypothetical protein ACPGVN_04870 [Alphaproteobacteria bacterium]